VTSRTKQAHADAVVGAYRLIRRLGAGGMGEVWIAEHTRLNRRAAIKLLHPQYAARPDIVARFFNEARAATSIADPGIVQIFDFDHTEEDGAYIAMELLEGETLDARWRRLGIVPIEQAVRVLRQVASSLGAAHAQGIVHRDLKPENIFLARDPEVAGGERAKILDFGIAKLGGDAGVKTETSALLGTPIYMSPEQCRGAGKVDQRSDVYSLACVLFAIVSGRPPFLAEGAGELVMLHITAPAPRLSSIVPGVSASLDDLVARCLQKDPAARFMSGAELANAMLALGDPVRARIETPPRAFVPVSVANTTLSESVVAMTPAPAPPPRRRGHLVLAFAATVTIAGAATTFVATRATRRQAAIDSATISALPDATVPDAPRPAMDAGIESGSPPTAEAPSEVAPQPVPQRTRPAGRRTAAPRDAGVRAGSSAQTVGQPDASAPTLEPPATSSCPLDQYGIPVCR
jgi:serine/threonine-protein kinase